ncbi:2-oxoisovalerate dehydrogenase E2 component (dihydrolipoyl transacylase) [Mycobacterium frederiksbergense]|uniref:Dihydrolipoamide acetyltransferase component of pyruvate dehydrogenase complex n=1 Tax=Mycolicibacterium frederiksbergense TaxID=117567 RepID=A0ABT6KVS3_9MYCO|nr:dihydrolipoamide acetyltransferase family protein [Mycolicibacterium frederiksbergense]MDH6194814.1 2-oxoisovalerate dehydrogenase E2 component (dihydrolipoyl transacylase) [Mycolicibacterium frederiksbergense]
MSDQTFLLPDLGEGLTEAEIAGWRVEAGDTVSIDDVVVEVETAKAAVEVPIPFAGTVVTLHGEAGSTLAVGSPLITIRTSEQFQQYRQEERAGSGNVLIGYGTSEPPSRRNRRRRTPVVAGPGTKVISPVVRKLARDNHIDLSGVPASGAGGVITRADVDKALLPADAPASEQRIAITGVRKAIADKLSISRRDIPDATTWVDVDATALLEARRSVAAATDRAVSLLALLARFTVAALQQFPELNSSVDIARSEIVRHGQVNLGVAVQTPRGLLVPVIEQAERLDTVTLSDALTETITKARDGALPPARFTGGTFTLNNYGVFGVDGSTPIINHPEAAILGVGRIIDRPWVVDGGLAVRKVTQVSLSFDHRVCDGGAAGGFLRLFADFIENPVAVIGWL